MDKTTKLLLQRDTTKKQYKELMKRHRVFAAADQKLTAYSFRSMKDYDRKREQCNFRNSIRDFSVS